LNKIRDRAVTLAERKRTHPPAGPGGDKGLAAIGTLRHRERPDQLCGFHLGVEDGDPSGARAARVDLGARHMNKIYVSKHTAERKIRGVRVEKGERNERAEPNHLSVK
jgi:hypothetical protein